MYFFCEFFKVVKYCNSQYDSLQFNICKTEKISDNNGE